MVTEANPPRTRPQGKKRVPRGSLSREVIIEAAFRSVDEDAAAEVTTGGIGRQLGADPSAVYRHFRSKDELLRAMADVIFRESLTEVVETDDPLENLRRLTWSLRRSFLQRPRLTRTLLLRFTGGSAEEVWALTALRNVEALGFNEATSVTIVRSLGELTTSHMTLTAEALSLPRAFLVADLERASNLVPTGPAPVRLDEASDDELRRLHLEDGDKIFDCMLEHFLAGVAGRAPARPRTAKSGSRPPASKPATKRPAARARA